jgi:DNA-binding IclR family transcriptional regulator
MNQNKIFRVIKLMELLKKQPVPMYSMVIYLGISERSVYRYLKMYQELGYELKKNQYGKYFLK